MPEDRSQYKIEIKTTADLSGAKAHLAMLQGQREALQLMGKETKELDDQLEKLRHSINQAELFGVGEKAKEAGEGFKIMGHGTHEAHAALHALNELFPGLAQFARFLTSGFTVAVGATLISFEYLKDKIDEFSKALDELNSGPGARGEWAEKMAENTRNASVEAAVFDEHIRQITEAQQTLQQVTDQLIERQKAQTTTQREVAQAEKELAIARLALAEKLGEYTPEEVVRLRLQIHDKAFHAQLEAEKAAIQAELQARMNQLTQNEQRDKGLFDKKESTASSAEAAQNAADKNQAKLDQDKQNLENFKAKAEENDKKLEELYFQLQTPPVKIEEKLREKAAETLQSQIGGTQTAVNQEKAKQTALASAAAVAKEQAAKAKSDYEEAAKSAVEINATVQKLKADLAAATAKNYALEKIHHQQTIVQQQANDADLARKVQSGTATPDEQQQYADQQTQKGFARETGPQASIDAADAIARAKVTAANLRGRKPGDASADERNEMTALLLELSGLAQNTHAEINSQRRELVEQRRIIGDMNTRMSHDRGNAY